MITSTNEARDHRAAFNARRVHAGRRFWTRHFNAPNFCRSAIAGLVRYRQEGRRYPSRRRAIALLHISRCTTQGISRIGSLSFSQTRDKAAVNPRGKAEIRITKSIHPRGATNLMLRCALVPVTFASCFRPPIYFAALPGSTTIVAVMRGCSEQKYS